MGMMYKAKKGTVIEANGVRITVLRGSPRLEITAPPEVVILTGRVEVKRSRETADGLASAARLPRWARS